MIESEILSLHGVREGFENSKTKELRKKVKIWEGFLASLHRKRSSAFPLQPGWNKERVATRSNLIIRNQIWNRLAECFCQLCDCSEAVFYQNARYQLWNMDGSIG